MPAAIQSQRTAVPLRSMPMEQVAAPKPPRPWPTQDGRGQSRDGLTVAREGQSQNTTQQRRGLLKRTGVLSAAASVTPEPDLRPTTRTTPRSLSALASQIAAAVLPARRREYPQESCSTETVSGGNSRPQSSNDLASLDRRPARQYQGGAQNCRSQRSGPLQRPDLIAQGNRIASESNAIVDRRHPRIEINQELCHFD